jgi:hypothetical protein
VIQVFVSYQRRSRRFKFSTDRDCLPPDIDCFTEREVEDLEVLKEAGKVLEAWGSSSASILASISTKPQRRATDDNGRAVCALLDRVCGRKTRLRLCLQKGATEVKRQLCAGEEGARGGTGQSASPATSGEVCGANLPADENSRIKEERDLINRNREVFEQGLGAHVVSFVGVVLPGAFRDLPTLKELMGIPRSR